MKVDTSALRAAIAEEIKKQDALAEKASLQILQEGINAAKANVLKDTHALEQSIDTASKVERTGPYQFNITWGASLDYTMHQEFGPKSGKRVWRFRPFIRPAAAIAQQKAEEIIDRVWSEG